MNRPIKFRGRDIDGKFHYGDLIHLKGKLVIFNDKESVTVDSIAQLVGFDVDGNEVYEGDLLVDEGGQRYYSILASEVSSRWCPNFRLDLVVDGTCEFTLEQETEQ